MILDETQLLTPTEAASLKGFSLNHFKYLLEKQGGLTPICIGRGHLFYLQADVESWFPRVKPRKRLKNPAGGGGR